MVAPTLTSDQPGLEVLAEVARILAAGPPAEDGLGSGLAVLRRAFALRRCRLWLRPPDGSRYTPLSPASDEPEPRDAAADVAAWIAKGPDRAPVAGGTLDRSPPPSRGEGPRGRPQAPGAGRGRGGYVVRLPRGLGGGAARLPRGGDPAGYERA